MTIHTVSLARLRRAKDAEPVVASARPIEEFNLSRRFALLGLLVIAAVSLVTSVVLSRFLAREMLQHDGKVAMQFIQSSTVQNNAEGYFLQRDGDHAALRQTVETYLRSIVTMPDVLRAQVYSASGEVLWSSEQGAINRTFTDNPELEEALRGQVAVEADLIESRHYIKPEHVFKSLPERQFAEYYLPVWNTRGDRVIGAVEIYKTPAELFRSIQQGLQLIWLCGVAGALSVYLALFWVVRRGHNIIREQQRRIASNEGFAAVGEIAAAVAHNIRNPLAAIRSSAELMISDCNPAPGCNNFARDIMADVDRLESWVRELLNHASTGSRKPAAVAPNQVVREQIEQMAEDFARTGVHVDWRLTAGLPEIRVDALMLGQIVHTLATNALEAMPGGGRLAVGSRAARLQGGRAGIEVSITDSGVGIPAAKLHSTFTAPRSTKTNGLGIGLPLVARTLERMGGLIAIRSQAGHGTCVTFTLPCELDGKSQA